MSSASDQPFGPWNCKDCRKCGKKPVFTEVTVKNGEKVERQLCEECAREEGIGVQSNAPINQLMAKFVMSQSSAGESGSSGGSSSSRAASCGSCGLPFAEFRKTGLLGCHDCYRSFEEQLGPLIERAHEGGTHHVGKIPKRGGASLDRRDRIAALRKQLTEAIACEQYERAAVLRDEIRTFEGGGGELAGGGGSVGVERGGEG